MTKKAKDFEGKSILEVWDFRLSKGCPTLYCDGEFWRVVIYDNYAPNGEAVILDEYTTSVETNGDPHDKAGIAACYEWLYSVRDKHSRDHIEERKPVVAMINAANRRALELSTEIDRLNEDMVKARDSGDYKQAADAATEAFTKRQDLNAHLAAANQEIREATEKLHAEINGGAA